MSLLRRIRTLFRRWRFEAEMAEELRAHLEMQAEANRADGMDAEEARYAARRQFGHVDGVKEAMRAQRGWVWLDQFAQDIRYGIRGLSKHPGHTFVAIVTLALGISACTALFSVVYGVLLHPFAYRQPDGIWIPFISKTTTSRRFIGREPISEFRGIRQLPAVSEAMASAYLEDAVVETTASPPEDLDAVLMSPNAFRFLGVRPLLGRSIGAADFSSSGEARPVVVLSYAYWQRAFDGDPQVLGKTLTVNRARYVVVGVMPRRFGWYTDRAIWLPLAATNRHQVVNTYIRLKPGIPVAVATQQLQAYYTHQARKDPREFPAHGFLSGFVNLLGVTAASGRLRANLELLSFAVGFLLLIACTNVVNLQLVRTTVRCREIAIRVAVGATRSRLVRQLLVEGMLLSAGGGVIGVGAAFGLTRFIMAVIPPGFVPNGAHVTVNGPVLWIAAGLTVLAGLVTGAVPALHSGRTAPNDALTNGGWAATAGRSGTRTRGALVTLQVALSVILLVGAALTIRGFVELEGLDLGFATQHLLRVRLPKVSRRFATYERSIAFDQEVLDRVRTLPGVEAAAIGNVGFPLPGGRSRFAIEGLPKEGPRHILCGLVSRGFLRTMQIPLRRGRNFTAEEIAGAKPVCLISEAAARLWPAGENPTGWHIRLAWLAEPSKPEDLAPLGERDVVTVVGVIGDMRPPGVLGAPPTAVFVPYTLRAPRWRMVALRTRGDAAALLPAVRELVRSIDPDEPIDEPTTVGAMIAQHMTPPRFSLLLFVGLAATGFMLALAGVYGVISFQMARREREFGIRMALGADRPAIAGLVLKSGARLIGSGLVLGIAGSLALTRFITSEVFIRSSLGPLSVVAAGAFISASALLACVLPARRATKINPVEALRAE